MESTSREHKVTNHQPLDPATDETSQDDITTRLRRDCMSLIADEAADTIDRLRAELQVMADEHRLACEDRDLMQRERDEARRKVCWLLRSWVKTEKDVALERGWDCFENSPLDRLAKLDEECGLQ